MRHRVRGRHLGRTPSHRKAMFRNMAVSMIRSTRVDEDEVGAPKYPGRIVTTVAKAKELRPFIEKLVTIGRKSLPLQRAADELMTSAEKNSDEWRRWRDSEQWNEWNQAQAPVLALQRRAFSMLRDKEAVDILFTDLAERFEDRPGGYTRVIKLATRRLGDGGFQAMIEFVGERDRTQQAAAAPVVSDDEDTADEPTDEVAEDESAEAPATADVDGDESPTAESEATESETVAADDSEVSDEDKDSKQA